MRTLITELKRMLFEKKLIYLTVITVVYVVVCCLFWHLKFRLDYGYNDISYPESGFKLWQDTMCNSYMTVLLSIVPTLIYALSIIDDIKEGIDKRICVQNGSCFFYIAKYITSIIGGMIYNFFAVFLIYFPLQLFLSTGNNGWNYLDRSEAVVGNYFTGDTAMEFVAVIAISYAFIGGVCAGMSFVISIWCDNKVIVCITPYIIFRILKDMLKGGNMIYDTITGYVDIGLHDVPFSVSISHFLWWFSLLSILLIFSFMINVEWKR